MLEKLAFTLFFIYFFLLSALSFPRNTSELSLPSNFQQKIVKKLPEVEKHFSFFLINYFTFSLSPDHKKQNYLLFPPFLSLKWENRTEKRPKNFLFYFFAP